MKKNIVTILAFAIAGLLLGYLFFGKIAGEYVNITTLLKPASNEIVALGQKVSGITKVRNHIAICGGIGALLGIIIRIVKK